MPNLKIVTLLGRPNVGKSALFNRLLQRRTVLVASTPGLTRDRLIGQVHWRGTSFQLVDTGGLQFNNRKSLSKAMETQVIKAIHETDIALLVCDAQEGIMPLDSQVAQWVRRFGKPILIVVNKVDHEDRQFAVHEFSRLGFGTPLAISSLHGRGIGDLLDVVVERVQSSPSSSVGSDSETAPLRVAIVGRPNVGKSSLINRLLNEQRILVDDQPGTTRDPVEVRFEYKDQEYCLIDTAGVRSRTRMKTMIDSLARRKSLEVIRRTDVCIGILDAAQGLVKDDLKLMSAVIEAGKPFCLVVNKWDLMDRSMTSGHVATQIHRQAPFLRFVPILCVSSKTGFHVVKILELAKDLAHRAHHRITSEERQRLLQIFQTDPGAPVALRHMLLFRLLQLKGSPPTFRILGKAQKTLKDSDIAYLEGIARRELKMEGIPIRFELRLWGTRR